MSRQTTCSCGSPKDRHAARCRACYRASVKGTGVNNFATRPDLVEKCRQKVECPDCGLWMKPASLARHAPNHDVWARVDASGDCWEWTGYITKAGYGIVNPGGGAPHQFIHRWVYEQLVGPIPSGHHLDHLCRVKHCVNPDHLEAVSPVENWRRGFSPSMRLHRLKHGIRQYGNRSVAA